MQINKSVAMSLILIFSAPLTLMANAQAKQVAKITPQHVADKQNWRALLWLAKGDKLTVTNTGTTAVLLKREITLMPDEMPLMLNKRTILPGETVPVFGACPHHLPQQKEVIIHLLQTGESQTLPLNH